MFYIYIFLVKILYNTDTEHIFSFSLSIFLLWLCVFVMLLYYRNATKEFFEKSFCIVCGSYTHTYTNTKKRVSDSIWCLYIVTLDNFCLVFQDFLENSPNNCVNLYFWCIKTIFAGWKCADSFLFLFKHKIINYYLCILQEIQSFVLF